jgi:hypothetical protein
MIEEELSLRESQSQNPQREDADLQNDRHYLAKVF